MHGEELSSRAPVLLRCSRDNPDGLHLRFSAPVTASAATPRSADYQGATESFTRHPSRPPRRGELRGRRLHARHVRRDRAARHSVSPAVSDGRTVARARPRRGRRRRYFTIAAELRREGADEVLTSSEGRFYRDARRNG